MVVYACMHTCALARRKKRRIKFMVEYRISSCIAFHHAPFFESLQVWGLLSDLIPVYHKMGDFQTFVFAVPVGRGAVRVPQTPPQPLTHFESLELETHQVHA